MKQYTATANDDGVRLSRFVQSVTRDFPTSLYCGTVCIAMQDLLYAGHGQACTTL